MKKKLLERDGFYVVLFLCICLLAVGGIWFTNRNVEELASNDLVTEKEDKNEEDKEIHFVEDKETVPTTTESKDNLEEAKKEAKVEVKESKLSFLGTEVMREYSEDTPSYSQTLDLWEVHKALDVSANLGYEVKSLLSGEVCEIFEDEEHGMTIKILSEDNTVITYSNLDENINLEKGQKVSEGEIIGLVGETSFVESEEGSHVHIEAFKDDIAVNPIDFIN